jgi:hypothetical protein
VDHPVPDTDEFQVEFDPLLANKGDDPADMLLMIQTGMIIPLLLGQDITGDIFCLKLWHHPDAIHLAGKNQAQFFFHLIKEGKFDTRRAAVQHRNAPIHLLCFPG